jgi:hypothetical protein
VTPSKVGADNAVVAGVPITDLPREPMGPVEPVVSPIGDDLRLTWPGHQVTLDLSHLHEGREGITAELLVTSAIDGEIHWGRLNLLSGPARATLAKTLERAAPVAPWALVLERACRLTALHVREGAPVICLMPRRAPVTRHLIPKLLLAGQTNVLFGDGDSGKSLTALALMVAAGAPCELPAGLSPTGDGPVRGLYLDYEGCPEDHEDRLAKLLDGLGLTETPPILYRQMVRPLADEAAFIRAQISQHQIGFVIVDSLAPACGPEPEGADAAVRTFNALRSFGAVTRLLIAHVSHASAAQRTGPSKPFGSIFNFNLARNMWEVRRAEDPGPGTLVQGLYHRKFNAGERQPPFGLRFTFSEGSITLHAHDMGQEPDLVARASVPQRLLPALRLGAFTTAELSAQVGATAMTVRRALERFREKGLIVSLPDTKPLKWGLARG